MAAALIATCVGCAGTLIAWLAAVALARRLRHPPWANPVLLAALLLMAALWATGVPVQRYLAATQPLRWAMAAAIVGLAATIHAGWPRLRGRAVAVLAAVAAGATVGVGTAVAGARLLGLPTLFTQALATKSVSSPFAIAIMRSVGGPEALAAAAAVATGIVGALILPPLLRRCRLDADRLDDRRLDDDIGVGLALGQAAHVVGTDLLARRRPGAAPFAGLALTIAGVLTALALPPLWRWLFG